MFLLNTIQKLKNLTLFLKEEKQSYKQLQIALIFIIEKKKHIN